MQLNDISYSVAQVLLKAALTSGKHTAVKNYVLMEIFLTTHDLRVIDLYKAKDKTISNNLNQF